MRKEAVGSAKAQHDAAPEGNKIHEAAQHGISGPSGSLPYLAQIQKSFGHHDVSQVKAHMDPRAEAGVQAMGAVAFATGDHVAFAGTPSLHTAAHEAAHVVQQRAGVQLKGGVGEAGDLYEQHADAVADKVVRGESSEPLLDGFADGASEQDREGRLLGLGSAAGPREATPRAGQADRVLCHQGQVRRCGRATPHHRRRQCRAAGGDRQPSEGVRKAPRGLLRHHAPEPVRHRRHRRAEG